MEALRFIVLSACVLAFVACVIGGLLILFEQWHPKRASTVKWLVGGVLVSAVGAVMPQGGNLFQMMSGSEDSAQQRDADASSSQESSAPATPVAPAPSGLASSRPGPADPATERTERVQMTADWASMEVQAWARQNLPSRPYIRTDWEDFYPDCAAKSGLTPNKARECLGGRMAQFNQAILLPYQLAYSDYIPELERHAIQQEEGEILSFLRTEHRAFTMRQDPQSVLYAEVSNRWEADRTSLLKVAY